MTHGGAQNLERGIVLAAPESTTTGEILEAERVREPSPAEIAAKLVAVALACAAPQTTGFWVAMSPGATFLERVCALLDTLEQAPFALEVAETEWFPFGRDRGLRIPRNLLSNEALLLSAQFLRHPEVYFAQCFAPAERALLLREFRANAVLEQCISRGDVVQWLWWELSNVMQYLRARLPDVVTERLLMDLEQICVRRPR